MPKPITKVVLALSPSRAPSVISTALKLIGLLQQHQVKISLLAREAAHSTKITDYHLPEVSEKQLAKAGELILVVGGDGTFVHHALLAAKAKVPILAINCGRMGFLNEVSREDFMQVIPEILKGKYTSTSRMILQGQVERDPASPGQELFGVNDIVVQSLSGRLLEVQVFIDGKFAYLERADGIIAATSAGSSAYAMSAGGPFILPQADSFEVVTICPHSLSSCPIILPQESRVTIELVSGTRMAVFSDGQNRGKVAKGTKIHIRKAKFQAPLLHHRNYDVFSAYRKKLGWHSRNAHAD